MSHYSCSVSGFWNTINIGLLLRLILDVLLLPRVQGDLVDGEYFQGAGSEGAPGCYTPPCLGAAHGYDHCLAGTTMVLATMLAACGQSHDPRALLPTVGWAAATAAPSAPCFPPPRMNVLGNGYAPIPVAALLLPFFFPISWIFCSCSRDCMLSRLILHYLISLQSLRGSRRFLGAAGCWQPPLSWLIIGLLNASCLWLCRAVSNRWVWDCSTVVQSFWSWRQWTEPIRGADREDTCPGLSGEIFLVHSIC